ncbi:hypothetical protein [Dysgonomonas capnocytophagoides]|uniref:hypothetical protein n=1 Tax=Dysgonomonas capnocytophagoides TaxID=45254 RepID=UPI00291D93DA|nr:hypothetical protein DCPSUM001_33490 [Dysgonomonas capnocytophagoides]
MAKKLKRDIPGIVFKSGTMTYRISGRTVLIDSGYCRASYDISTAPYTAWSMMIQNAKDKGGEYETVLNVYANALISVISAMPNKDVIETLAVTFETLLSQKPTLQD